MCFDTRVVNGYTEDDIPVGAMSRDVPDPPLAMPQGEDTVGAIGTGMQPFTFKLLPLEGGAPMTVGEHMLSTTCVLSEVRNQIMMLL